MASFTLKIEITKRNPGAAKLATSHFHKRTDKPAKGKGSFARRAKHRGSIAY